MKNQYFRNFVEANRVLKVQLFFLMAIPVITFLLWTKDEIWFLARL